MIKLSTLCAAGLILAAAVPAHAQANACKGKIFATTVYGHQTAPGHFEYILQLQNGSKKPLGWQVDFKNMPAGVNVYKPTQTSTAPLASGAATSIRFGTGTNASVSSNNVSVDYDKPGAAITVSNCK